MNNKLHDNDGAMELLNLIGHAAAKLSKVPSVLDQPTVVMRPWGIYELDNGDRHLVGVVDELGYRHSGRITSVIHSIDYELLEVTTSSGRRYFLRAPAVSSESDSTRIFVLWQSWCMRQAYNGAYQDMTQAIVDEHLKLLSPPRNVNES